MPVDQVALNTEIAQRVEAIEEEKARQKANAKGTKRKRKEAVMKPRVVTYFIRDEKPDRDTIYAEEPKK